MSTQDELFWHNMFKLADKQKVSAAQYKTIADYHKTFQKHLAQLTDLSPDESEEQVRLSSCLLQAKKMAFSVLAILSDCIITRPGNELLSIIENYEQTFFDLLHKVAIESIDFQQLVDEAKIKIIDARYQPDLEILSDVIESIDQPLITLPIAQTPDDVWHNLQGLLLHDNAQLHALEKKWRRNQAEFTQFPFDRPWRLRKLRGKKLETVLSLIDCQLKSAVLSPNLKMNIHQESIIELKKILSSEGVPERNIQQYSEILSHPGTISLTPQTFQIYMLLLARHRKKTLYNLPWCNMRFWEFPISIQTRATFSVIPLGLLNTESHQQLIKHKKQQPLLQKITFELIRLNQSILIFRQTLSECSIEPFNIQHELSNYLSVLKNQYSEIENHCRALVETCSHHKALSQQKKSPLMMGQVLELQISILQAYSQQFSNLLECFKDWSDASLNQSGNLTQADRQTVQACYSKHAAECQANIQATLSRVRNIQDNLTVNPKKKKTGFSLRSIVDFLKPRYLQKKSDQIQQRHQLSIFDSQIAQLSAINNKIEMSSKSALDHISSVRFISRVFETPSMDAQNLLQAHTEKQTKNFCVFLEGREMKDCYLDSLCDEIKALDDDHRTLYWVEKESDNQRLLQQSSLLLSNTSQNKEGLQRFESKYHYLEQIIRYFTAVKKESYLHSVRELVDLTLSNIASIDEPKLQSRLHALRCLLGPSKSELKQLFSSRYKSTKQHYEHTRMEFMTFKKIFSPITQDKMNCLIQIMLRRKINTVNEACRLVSNWNTIAKQELNAHDKYQEVIKMIETLYEQYILAKQLLEARDNLDKDIIDNVEESFSPNKVNAYLQILNLKDGTSGHKTALTCHP